MMTTVGPVTFRDDGTGDVLTLFIRWQEGTTELVCPADSATADFVYPAPPLDET